MSPEESGGAAPSEASDWYGVGVTLYEAITGTVPFAGSFLDVLLRKTTDDPPAPSQLVAGVPANLDAICLGLLHRDPDQRLSGVEALRLLAPHAAASVAEIAPAPPSDAPFIGRNRQLQLLHDAFLAVTNGDAAAVSVHGPSGIGKSALVRHFLSWFGARGDVVVLSGRCYENESVPYKALDGVVDDLSRYLGSIPRSSTPRPLNSSAPTWDSTWGPSVAASPSCRTTKMDPCSGGWPTSGWPRRTSGIPPP